MNCKISIIIPTLNEENYVGELLHDLSKQTHSSYETIVVDGNSTDKTSRVVKKYRNVRFIRTRANVAHQRDIGAKKASGNLLVFLDADTRIDSKFLSKIQAVFAKSSIAIACPFYIPSEPHFSSLILYLVFNTIFFLVQKVAPSGAGSCIIVRKKTYIALGGFDERYTYDDMQFLSKSKRLRAFQILPIIVRVSNRRIKKLGLIRSLVLYSKLSWYFIKNDYTGANSIRYPFGIYS